MQIRQILESELESVSYLGSQAFAFGRRESYTPHPDEEPREAYGVYDDRGLQAQVVVISYETHLGADAVISMGGIAGVVCLPESRGRGYVGACLDYTLERMRENGHLISLLFPFSFDFYRRFGWEWVGRRKTYLVPTRILLPDPQTENVRAATIADRGAIRDLYTRYAKRYRGMLQRIDHVWNGILDDSKERFTYTYLYEQDGTLEGYLTYRGGKGEKTELREFITITEQARRALLGLLRRHDMQIEKFAWGAPPDDRLWSVRTHWDIETQLRPECQARVVNLVGALQAWHPERSASGRVVLALQDEHAPWNQGVWRTEFDGGEVSVEETRADPQVSMDIQALSQAYLGTPDLEELRLAERLTVYDEAGYEALRALLVGPPMHINDSF